MQFNQSQENKDNATVMTDSKPAMNKTYIFAAIAVALAFFAGAAYYLANNTVGDADAKELASAQVEITPTGFVPSTVKVKKGQQLTWTNTDSVAHQTAGTNNNSQALNTDTVLNQNESVTVTLEQSGTFEYHDSLTNTDFKGTIIVE